MKRISNAVQAGAVLFLAIGLAACSDSSNAGTDGWNSVPKGWAASANEFRSRWNTIVDDTHALEAFDDGRARFLGGTSLYTSNMVSISTFNLGDFPTMCAIAYSAAYGADMAEAKSVVGTAVAQGKNTPSGRVEYNGHVVNLYETGNNEAHCDLFRKEPKL